MGHGLRSLPVYVREGVLSFLVPEDRQKAACATGLLSSKVQFEGAHGWSFTCDLLQRGRRSFRWGCWDKPDKERRFLHAAIERYTEVMSQPDSCFSPSLSNTPCFIPRIVHTIWLGGAPPPFVGVMRKSWMRHHPDWEHRLWTDADLDRLPLGLTNREAFVAAANYGEKSDILRYEVLYQIGGLYADCDFECVARFHDLHGWPGVGLYMGLSSTGTMEVNNGLIGSRPGHPLLSRLIQDIKSRHHEETKQDGKAVGHAAGGSALSSSAKKPLLLLVPRHGGGAANSISLSMMSSFLGGADSAALQVVAASAEQERASMETIERTGPGLLSRHIFNAMLLLHHQVGADVQDSSSDDDALSSMASDILVLPPCWFYPIPNNAPPSLSSSSGGDLSNRLGPIRDKYVRRGVTRAVHFWAKSWQR